MKYRLISRISRHVVCQIVSSFSAGFPLVISNSHDVYYSLLTVDYE